MPKNHIRWGGIYQNLSEHLYPIDTQHRLISLYRQIMEVAVILKPQRYFAFYEILCDGPTFLNPMSAHLFCLTLQNRYVVPLPIDWLDNNPNIHRQLRHVLIVLMEIWLFRKYYLIRQLLLQNHHRLCKNCI